MANQGKLFFEANFGGGRESFITENNIVSWGPYTPGYEDNTFHEEKLWNHIKNVDVLLNFPGCILNEVGWARRIFFKKKMCRTRRKHTGVS